MLRRLILPTLIILLFQSRVCNAQSSTEPLISTPFLNSQTVLYDGYIKIPYSAGSVNVQNNANVIIESGSSILLKNGFEADTYTGCNSFYAYINPIPESAITPSANHNFIYTRIPNQPVQTEAVLDNLSISDKHVEVDYFDGIGRPLQHIDIKSSPNWHDIVSPFQYDGVGREPLKYSPYESVTSNGMYQESAIADQGDFYSNPSFGILATHYAFAQALFDNSPFERVIESGSPGDDWKIDVDHHTVRSGYYSNVSNEIPLWQCTTSGASALNSAGSAVNYYLPGALFVHEIKDENADPMNSYLGNASYEYKDVQGRVICIRRKARTDAGETYDFTNGGNFPLSGSNHFLYTFYVYNDAGQLAYVIPPSAYNYMLGNAGLSFNETNSVFDDFIYGYHYDGQDRVVEKKTPGQTGWQWMCYDKLDRIVLISNPEDHKLNTSIWSFTKYDVFGRVIMSGNYSDPSNFTQATVQALVDASGALWEDRDNTAALGYTSNAFPLFPNDIYTVSYYDDYDFAFDATLNSRGYQNYLPNSLSNLTKNLVTAYKVKGPGSIGMLNGLNYYNEDGELIQQQKQNHLGDWDIINCEYDFNGAKIIELREHRIAGHSPLLIRTRYSYDHEKRLTDIYKQIDSDPQIHMVYNEYNAFGQLVSKTLHLDPTLPGGYLQKIDYRYNSRGWLTSINNTALVNDYGQTNSDDKDAFGEEIFYANASLLGVDQSSSNAPVPLAQYNGNISAVSWKTKPIDVNPYDVPEDAYVYRYDELNRMTAGYYCGSHSGYVNWYDIGFHGYDEKLNYDFNGNITRLKRSHNQLLTDDLSYGYSGNVLQSVSDAVTTVAPGFTDFVSTQDYTYDRNGNLTSDKNKGIRTISYNYLNLPTQVITDLEMLEYGYDYSGKKLYKKLNGTQVRNYDDGIEYQDGNLEFILSEEGRIRPKSPLASNSESYVYDYFLKDHLGNIRAVVSTENIPGHYVATMETQNVTVEEQLFYNLPTTRTNLPAGYPLDNSYSPNLKGAVVNKGIGKPVGPATVIPVNEGDQIDISVKYFFSQHPTGNGSSPVVDLLTQLANVFFLNPSNGISIAGSDQSARQLWANQVFNNNSEINSFLSSNLFSTSNNTSSIPQANLVYLFYDDQFNFVAALSGVEHVTYPNILGTLTVSGLIAPVKGYMYIYVNNESTSDVYFDNLHIVRTGSSLKEKNDYYPFGLLVDGLSNNAHQNVNQFYKYNGKELQKDVAWNVEDYGARYYDPVIGRWAQVDPLAEKYGNWSPYTYALNNPVRFVDDVGMEPSPGWFAENGQQEMLASDHLGAANPPLGAIQTGQPLSTELGPDLQIMIAIIEPIVTSLNTLISGYTEGGAKAGFLDKVAAIGTIIVAGAMGKEGEAGIGETKIGGVVGKGAANPKIMEAIKNGKEAHKAFSKKAEAKGWSVNPRLTDPLTGKTVIPDVVTKSGKPLEYKPNTRSGKYKGKRQLPQYERATGQKGRVIYYKPKKKD